MTPDHARKIVARLVAAYPNAVLDEASVDLFVKEIALLYNYEFCVQAADVCIRNGQKFPTIRELRQAYHGVAERDRVGVFEDVPPVEPMPTYFKVYLWSLYEREPANRKLPEEARWADVAGDLPHGYLTRDEYQELELEWRAAGSPSPSKLSGSLLKTVEA